MSETCDRCPCEEICLRRPEWCEWARTLDPGTIRVRSICERSAIEVARQAYPPLAEQAGNLVAAAGRIVGAVFRGRPVLAPPEVIAERRSICAGCEHFDPAQERCRKCGCGRLKLDLATEKCPIDRWAAYG